MFFGEDATPDAAISWPANASSRAWRSGLGHVHSFSSLTARRRSSEPLWKVALRRFSSVPGMTGNARFGSNSSVRQAVDGCPVIAHRRGLESTHGGRTC
jgi:hypothetical protein